MFLATVLKFSRWALAALVTAGACYPAVAQVTIDVATIPGFRVPFQSHNQKVVQNDYGIFATRGDRESVPGHFWLNRSTDGGRTFTTVYEEAYSVNPPTLETDEANNLYLIFPRSDSSGTRFMKFASGNYSSPAINKTITSASSGGKFASFYDRSRGLLYHATQTGYFLVFDKSGNLTTSKWIWKTGGGANDGFGAAGPSYPHLFVETNGVIPAPAHVRYAYSPQPSYANLFNKDGLPALTFTTEKLGPAARPSQGQW
ncbi:MAG: hypothetical protein NTV49_04995 [Kiritimatiellaeota bacterium]|nr:hypothetical protein [Kiritimatiellota bacterium]